MSAFFIRARVERGLGLTWPLCPSAQRQVVDLFNWNQAYGSRYGAFPSTSTWYARLAIASTI